MTQSTIRPNEVEYLQNKKIVNFDIVETTNEDEETIHEYKQVKLELTHSYGDAVEAILGYDYSVGRELSAINDKDSDEVSYNEYMNSRVSAKELALKILSE